MSVGPGVLDVAVDSGETDSPAGDTGVFTIFGGEGMSGVLR